MTEESFLALWQVMCNLQIIILSCSCSIFPTLILFLFSCRSLSLPLLSIAFDWSMGEKSAYKHLTEPSPPSVTGLWRGEVRWSACRNQMSFCLASLTRVLSHVHSSISPLPVTVWSDLSKRKRQSSFSSLLLPLSSVLWLSCLTHLCWEREVPPFSPLSPGVRGIVTTISENGIKALQMGGEINSHCLILCMYLKESY